MARTSALGGQAPGTPKSGKARTVDLNVTLVEVLRDTAAAQRQASMRRGGAGELPTFVCPSRLGGPLDDGYVRTVFERLLARAGLPAHHTPHSLRHTSARCCWPRGCP